MRVKLIKRESTMMGTVAAVIQKSNWDENIEILKSTALSIAKEYENHIKINIEISTNPEKTYAKVNVTEFNL